MGRIRTVPGLALPAPAELRHYTPRKIAAFPKQNGTLKLKFQVDRACLIHGITIRIVGMGVDDELRHLDYVDVHCVRPGYNEPFPGVIFASERLFKFVQPSWLSKRDLVRVTLEKRREISNIEVMVALWCSERFSRPIP